jgi:hypothetical protein
MAENPKVHKSEAEKKHADAERDKKNRKHKPGRVSHFKKGTGTE